MHAPHAPLTSMPSSSGATRTRGSSNDKRPAWLRSGSVSGANTPSNINRRRSSIIVGMEPANKTSPEREELFYLPLEVRDEIELMENELNNYSTISDLTQKLSSGGPVGELGMIDATNAEIDALAIVLKKAQRVGIKTPLAAALCYTGQVVRELRQYLRDKDWNVVEATLRHVAVNNARVARSIGIPLPPVQPSYLPTQNKSTESTALPTSALPVIDVPKHAGDAAALELAAITLVMPGLAEVIRVEAEAQYRRVMEQMVAALGVGAASGSVGRIDTTRCDVGKLAVAIDAARALGSRTKQARHLSALCRLTWQMRSAVMEDDWPAVESLLVAGAAVLGMAEGQSEEDRAAVPATVRSEMDLYRAEAYNRRIVETFRNALRTKQASGEIGRLNMAEVDPKPLEEAVRLAMSLGVKTAEARGLLATSVHMRALRLALLGGNWTRLGELLDYYFTAEEKTKPYTRYGNNATLSVTGPGSSPNQSGVVSVLAGNNSVRPYATTNTKDGVGIMATWPGVVELSDGYDLVTDGVAMESAQEANIMQLELNNRNVIVELTKACASGAAQGTIGKLDVSTLRTGELDWAIDYATRIGCMTLEAEQVLATATVLRKVRMALGTGNWTALDEALASARGKELADVGAAEISAAQDELDNRIILSELASALAKGRPQGRTGRVYTGSIDLKPLNDAIALSQRLGPKTQESKQMLFTAKVVARLRMCLLNNDLAEASLTLEAINGKPLASVAIAEVRSIEDEVNNWTVITELGAAISKGVPTGSIGHLDLSSVDTTALVAALNHADALGIKTTEAGNLYAAAAAAYKLRTALLKDNWSMDDGEGVEAILAETESVPLSDLISGEIDLLRGEVHNRRIVMNLAQALARGGAKGPVGEMGVSEVDTAELDMAIATASELGTRTEEADRLLHAAKTIRRLRSVLLAGNWQWVGSVLLEARQLKHIFPPVSLKELQAAQDELDNKAILAQINAALRQGVPTGSIGHIDPDSVDVTVLDDALAYARSLGVKSVEASAAVAGAQIMRKLRVAVKANDWAEAADVLTSVGDRTLPSAGSDELQQIRLCVDNWKLISDLTIAVATGGPVGPLGDPDLRALRVDALDAAISLSGRLGVHTVEARRALVSALIIRRLRAALLDNDIAFLGQVLNEADTEADALLTQCKNEITYARDTVEFKSIMTALTRATEDQDETALVEVLSRSQKLRLADHPRTHVRATVESATLALTRIQRCKQALANGIRGMDAPALVDALAMAAGIGFTHTLVEEARRVLTRVTDITDRATAALRSMDALLMSAIIRECEGIGLQIPVLVDIRRVLSLPRNEYLRRELDAVLGAIASNTNLAGTDLVPNADGSTPSASAPLSSSARAPTALELRLINCTIQIKDIFFGDAPDSDEVIATALGSAGALVNTNAENTSASTSPGRQQLMNMLSSNPQAAAAIANLRVQRNTDENVRGAQIRLTPTIVTREGAYPMFLFAGPTNGAFRPEGYPRGVNTVSSMNLFSGNNSASNSYISGNNTSNMITVGSTIPPTHSALRRQFALDKFGRIKPPHMFSPRFPATISLAQSGLLRYQHEPIHTSLTLLQSADARRAAVKTFRNILAFMGDRPLSKPVALGAEVLSLGAATPELRDEILLQLCKQLSGNPSLASATRGWVLLYMCLCTFHPSDEFENHFELWLRENGAVPCVWALHLVQYRGGAGSAGIPSTAEIGMALERARAQPLPTFVQDMDSAGTLAEYASIEPPMYDTTNLVGRGPRMTESKAPESKDDPTISHQQNQNGALLSPDVRAAFEHDIQEDHALQLALLRATSGTFNTASMNRSLPSLPPAVPGTDNTTGPKKITPTKPGGNNNTISMIVNANNGTTLVGSASEYLSRPTVSAANAYTGRSNVPVNTNVTAVPRPATPTKPGTSNETIDFTALLNNRNNSIYQQPSTSAAAALLAMGGDPSSAQRATALDADLEARLNAVSKALEE